MYHYRANFMTTEKDGFVKVENIFKKSETHLSIAAFLYGSVSNPTMDGKDLLYVNQNGDKVRMSLDILTEEKYLAKTTSARFTAIGDKVIKRWRHK